MDSSSDQQLPPPSSYPGAPRRRPSADARAAAWLSGAVALLSVLVMAVVGERRERERERERKGGKVSKITKRGPRESASVFFFSFALLTLLEKNPKKQKPGATLTQLKQIGEALDTLAKLESMLP